MDRFRKLKLRKNVVSEKMKSHLLMMLWKNFIIKKRRRFELLLLLFNIFLYFGLSASRFAFTKTQWLAPAISTFTSPVMNFSAKTQLIVNHPIALSISDSKVFNDLKNTDFSDFSSFYESSDSVDVEFANRVVNYFHEDWQRVVGNQPIKLFPSVPKMIEAMKFDLRYAFGIEINELNRHTGKADINLHFLSDDIPTVHEVTDVTDTCRSAGPRFDSEPVPYLINESCKAGLYFLSNFVVAEASLQRAIIIAREELKIQDHAGNSCPRKEFLELDQPTSSRIEYPRIRVVAEEFPLGVDLHSTYAGLSKGLPMLMMFSFMRIVILGAHDILSDRESGLYDIFKIFGMSDHEYWFSWLITSSIMNLLYTSVAIIVCRLSAMFGASSYLLMTVAFYFYILSLNTGGYLIGSFLGNAEAASIVGLGLQLLFNIVAIILENTSTKALLARILLSFFSPIPFVILIQDVVKGLPRRPLTMSALFERENRIYLFYIFMLIVDAIGYWALAWYVSTVRKNNFGTAKPLNWPLVWLKNKFLETIYSNRYPSKSKQLSQTELPEDFDKEGKEQYFEPIPAALKNMGRAVAIRDLVKTYTVANEQKNVVNGLSLDIYKSEIFALLGHNGAGKTTTIHILSGMLPSDGGDATINGYSVKTAGEEARKHLSVCPQHNLFIDELICIEHLVFLAGLRGLNIREPLLKLQNVVAYSYEIRTLMCERAAQERFNAMHGIPTNQKKNDCNSWEGILDMIYKFGLGEHLFAFPRTLSGGQKRRLWLAFALIAEPAVVFLDEPTSGVDPLGRQEIWKFIQNEKSNGRCIVLTTHHMEEADILSDRLAVMAEGKLRCMGTSMFLKKQFSCGYYFKIQLQHDLSDKEKAESKKKIDEFVLNNFENSLPIESLETVGTYATDSARCGHLCYVLPFESRHTFGNSFIAFETMKEKFNVFSYGLSTSTLEEIFFKFADENFDQTKRILQDTLVPDVVSTGNPAIANVVDFDEANDDVDSRNIASDLTKDIMDIPPPIKWHQKLSGVIHLRTRQIFHKPMSYFFKLFFPSLMFFISILISRRTFGGIGYSHNPKTAPIDLTDYNRHLPNLIPYMVDDGLNSELRTYLADVLDQLPFKDRLLPLHPCMSLSGLRTFSADECVEAFYRAGRQSSVDFNDQRLFNKPQTHEEFLSGRVKQPRKYKKGHIMDELDFLNIFTIANELKGSKANAALLRNFIFRTSFVNHKSEWTNFYPTALYFQPTLFKLEDELMFQEAKVDDKKITIDYFWNPYAVHAFPSFLSAISNAIIKIDSPIVIDQTKKMKRRNNEPIRIVSKPLHRNMPIYITALTFAFYTLLSFTTSFFPHYFGSTVMTEKVTKTMHSLIVMGCPIWAYWVGSFIVHWGVIVTNNLFSMIGIVFFLPMLLQHLWSIPIIIITMLFYSASMLVYGYFWTFIFKSGQSYIFFMQFSTMLLSTGPAFLVAILHDYKLQIEGVPFRVISRILHKVVCFIFAPYNPIGALIGTTSIIAQARQEKRTARLREFFDPNNLVIYVLLGSLFQTLVYGILVIVFSNKSYASKHPNKHAVALMKNWLETRANIRDATIKANKPLETLPALYRITKDASVLQEEQRVKEIMTAFNAQVKAKAKGQPIPCKFEGFVHPAPKHLPEILINDVHYLYIPNVPSAEYPIAVKGVSYAVSKGEVLGLLGPNGAGKSTTLNMLTCDPTLDAPCIGDAYICGVSVSANPKTTFNSIGVVPQFDALWTDVSILDNLNAFARIKGLSKKEREEQIRILLDELDLELHKNKTINQLSGGNKRRAVIAIAFLANPRVILMDEPSSGIDPAGRRKLLEMIERRKENKAIIVTTHSMEEAESLCSRIAILVNGQMQCIDTCLAIKSTYGSGLTIHFELQSLWSMSEQENDSLRANIIQWLEDETGETIKVENVIANRFSVNVPYKITRVGELFNIIESKKDEFMLVDYSITQPSLDLVFSSFAKLQQELNND